MQSSQSHSSSSAWNQITMTEPLTHSSSHTLFFPGNTLARVTNTGPQTHLSRGTRREVHDQQNPMCSHTHVSTGLTSGVCHALMPQKPYSGKQISVSILQQYKVGFHPCQMEQTMKLVMTSASKLGYSRGFWNSHVLTFYFNISFNRYRKISAASPGPYTGEEFVLSFI